MTKMDKEQNFAWVEDFRKVQLNKSARNPGLAALMSFLAMGLGQIYAGHIDRGIILLSVHLFAAFTGYSLYSGGFMYDWLMSMLGSHALVGLSYIVTVFFILLWIYNIKDAYYLSIFSSFRDWFEVERVLLPSMGVPVEMLLSSKNASVGLIENKSSEEIEVEVPAEKPSMVKAEDDTVIDVTASKSIDDSHSEIDGVEGNDERDKEDLSNLDSTRDLVFMNSSWKLYAALTMVVCVGVGIGLYSSEKRKETSFQLAKDFTLAGVSKDTALVSSIAAVPKIGDNDSSHRIISVLATASAPTSAVEINQPLIPVQAVSPEPKLSQDDGSTVISSANVQAPAVSPTVPSPLIPPTEVLSAPKQESAPVQTNLLQQQVHIVFTQDQVDAYVEQRMRALLAAQANHRSSSSYDSPTDIAEDYLWSESSVKDRTRELPGNSSEILVIQGNKESKILKKNLGSEAFAQAKSKVLYEAAGKIDDEVEIIITDENANSAIEEGGKNLGSVAVSSKGRESVEVVPDISPSLIDKLKKDEEEVKPSTNTDSPKVVIAAKKAEDDEEDRGRAEKSEKDSPKENMGEVKKVETLSSNESPEYRIQLEKIKERGAYEFYQGNWEAALPFYFEVLKYRRNAESFEMVGIIFEKMNKLSDAFDAYENAYELGLTNKNNTARLGLIAEKLGEYVKAQKYLEKAISMSPKRADIILSYARCLDKQGESLAAGQVLAVLRDSTSSYAIKKAAEQEYQKIVTLRAKEFKEKSMTDNLSVLTE